ncbi:hypothetical protein [Deinococcus roseus]|uniref:HEPN domain-containing protein n=1 Tax=Deinococcus roseus TaxID=392414 RepID=A0ABQ2D4V0_9DEIO|nr:hypothetical protein [Deinococcus roseus]GGJ43410.1 hypothetical protein GCM10008938_32090 [Deinococcus roseus]
MLRLFWIRHHLKQAVVLLEAHDTNPALHLHDLHRHLENTARELHPLIPGQKTQRFKRWDPWSVLNLHFKLQLVKERISQANQMLQGQPITEHLLLAYGLLLEVHVLLQDTAA